MTVKSNCLCLQKTNKCSWVLILGPNTVKKRRKKEEKMRKNWDNKKEKNNYFDLDDSFSCSIRFTSFCCCFYYACLLRFGVLRRCVAMLVRSLPVRHRKGWLVTCLIFFFITHSALFMTSLILAPGHSHGHVFAIFKWRFLTKRRKSSEELFCVIFQFGFPLMM